MRLLVPSIVDPATFPGGAGTATRGLLELLCSAPIAAEADVRPSRPRGSELGHHVRQVASVLGSFVSRLPAKALYQRAGGYPDALRRRLSCRDYDLVLINGCDLLWVQDEVPPDVPVLVWAHNLEHELYARQLDSGPLARLMRGVLAADLAKLRRFEIEGLQRADGSLFLSSTEAERMRPYLRDHPPLVVPPLFRGELPVRQPRRVGRPVEVGFVANFGWWPNRDGLHWFLTEILPYCDGRFRLHLFGSGSHRFRGYAAGVIGHGYVADVSTIWSTCDVMICPIRTGGGVNIKLAEAVFHGVPVLATPHALEGLPLAPGAALAVAEDAQAWIEFMGGEALVGLASATVPRDDRQVFCADTHRDEISAYFGGLVRAAA